MSDEFIIIKIFNSYIDAHIVKGRLEANGISCWLQDEHLNSIIADPLLTMAMAGIKLMVSARDAERAAEILGNNSPPESEV